MWSDSALQIHSSKYRWSLRGVKGDRGRISDLTGSSRGWISHPSSDVCTQDSQITVVAFEDECHRNLKCNENGSAEMMSLLCHLRKSISAKLADFCSSFSPEATENHFQQAEFSWRKYFWCPPNTHKHTHTHFKAILIYLIKSFGRLARKISGAKCRLMSRAAWRRAEEDRRLMEGGSEREQLRDERSGNIQQPWGFSKKCKCFNIKVWPPLAVSSHSSFIFRTSFLLPKYILCPDLKPFYTNHLFSPEKNCLKICKKSKKKETASHWGPKYLYGHWFLEGHWCLCLNWVRKTSMGL